MLSRKQIDERLAALAVVDSVYFGANMCVNREREALETAQKLYRERDEARETIKRLNRRCSKAESAALVTVEDCKRQGVSFGRSLANWYAERLEARLRGEGE